MSGKIKLVKIETKSGRFAGEILKVTPQVKEKSLKVLIKSFARPDEEQLIKINEHFKELLHFSNNIEIETDTVMTQSGLMENIGLLMETLSPEAVGCAEVSAVDETLYFDVSKEVDREVLGFELESHEWMKGFDYKIRLIQKEKPKEKKAPSQGAQKAKSEGHIYGRIHGFEKTQICDLDERSGSVLAEGYVLGCEIIKTRSGKSYIIKFSLTDYTSSIGATLFVKSSTNIEKLEEIEKGRYLKVEGHAQIDKFSGELVLNVDSIAEGTPPVEKDTAPRKGWSSICTQR